MTVCIAALCSHEDKHAMVVCFDTEVQTDITRAQTAIKITDISTGWKALLAGTVPKTIELADLYRDWMKNVETVMTPSSVLEFLRTPAIDFRRRLAEQLSQAKFSIGYEDFLKHGKEWLDQDTHKQMLYEVSIQTLNNVELILYGVVAGEFLLFKLSQGELTQCEDFATIGSGAIVAEPILCQRTLARTKSLQETLYVVYEAKKLAEVTPGVGEDTKMGVQLMGSSPAFHWVSDKGLGILEDEFNRFGPKQWSAVRRPIFDYLSPSDSNATSSPTNQT